MKLTVRIVDLAEVHAGAAVRIGLQVRREVVGLVTVSAAQAQWETDIAVDGHGDAREFRGPAVQGRKGERFVYLSYGDVDRDGTYTMRGRAKLMLADAPEADAVTVAVRVAQPDGRLRTAQLRPPWSAWSAD